MRSLAVDVRDGRPRPAAACLGMSDLFDSTVMSRHLRARQLCSSCPITKECLDEALSQSRHRGSSHDRAVPDGTWGGLLWRSGRIVPGGFRERQRIAHGTDVGYYHHHSTHEQPCDACADAHAEVESRGAAS